MEGSAVITSKPFQELDPVVEGSAVITSKYAMKSPMSSKRTEICRTLMNKPGSLRRRGQAEDSPSPTREIGCARKRCFVSAAASAKYHNEPGSLSPDLKHPQP